MGQLCSLVHKHSHTHPHIHNIKPHMQVLTVNPNSCKSRLGSGLDSLLVRRWQTALGETNSSFVDCTSCPCTEDHCSIFAAVHSTGTVYSSPWSSFSRISPTLPCALPSPLCSGAWSRLWGNAQATCFASQLCEGPRSSPGTQESPLEGSEGVWFPWDIIK